MPTRDPAEAEALSAILERVRAAKGPDRVIDAALWLAMIEKPRPGDKIDRDMFGRWPSYTASIDAAVALVDRVLPGWIIERMADQASGQIGSLKAFGAHVEISDGRHEIEDRAASRPLAILAALLTAKLALTHQEASHDGR